MALAHLHVRYRAYLLVGVFGAVMIVGFIQLVIYQDNHFIESSTIYQDSHFYP